MEKGKEKNMKQESKEKLVDLLQEISYAHGSGTFWKAWSAMHKTSSAMPAVPDGKEPTLAVKG